MKGYIMQETMINLINSYGYFGIAMLIFVENVFPPIPSEVVLLFGGFMTISTDMNVWLVILAATIGSVLGAIALYLAGSYLGKERVKRLCTSKLGRFLHLDANSVERADSWFCKYRYKAVIICRCVPVLRSIISVPAGIGKMRLIPFLLLTTIGSAVWNTILVWLGATMGNAWETGLSYVGVYTKIAVGVLLIAAIIVVLAYKRRKKAEKAE